jgi:predicted P-loop ATPase
MQNKLIDPKNISQWVNHLPNKQPCNGAGTPIGINDRHEFMTYEQAVENNKENPEIAGIGFVFTEDVDLCGLDLDDCLDEQGELINEQVRELLEGYEGMVEISPSGKGLHLIMQGRKPAQITKTKVAGALGLRSVEWYDKNRYFTVTENYWKGQNQIVHVSGLLGKLEKIFSTPSYTKSAEFSGATDTRENKFIQPIATMTPEEIQERFDGDNSKADLAFCGELARAHPYDYQSVDHKFRASHLMRPKWDERHRSDGATYGQMTIQKAFSTLGCDSYNNLLAYLKTYFEFRFNEVKVQPEFREVGKSKWNNLEERDLNQILNDLRTRGGKLKITKQTLHETINTHSVSPRFDPIKSYFAGLEKWDGKDHFAKLFATLKTTNPAMSELLLKKWLRGLVATIVKRKGTVNHGVLVLKGKQGLGKTSFALRLLPEQMREYVHSGTIREDSKDAQMLLVRNLIINMDEMANLQRREAAIFKELVTKDEIQIRMPYDRTIGTFTRRASFIGSVNDSTFLNDPTGSRRFWVLDCLSIDWQHMPDMNKVYAQILHELAQGEQWYLTRQEENDVQQQNAQFQVPSIEDELVENFCEADDKARKSASEIRGELARASSTSEHEIRLKILGQVLTNRGYDSVRIGGVVKYKVRIKGGFNFNLGTPPSANKLFNSN